MLMVLVVTSYLRIRHQIEGIEGNRRFVLQIFSPHGDTHTHRRISELIFRLIDDERHGHYTESRGLSQSQ